MPRRKLFFFKTDSWEYGHDNPAQEQPLGAPKKRRAATTVLFCTLFFSGAALTAIAGDRYAQMSASDGPASTDTIASADASSAAPDGTTDATSADGTDASSPDATSTDAASADPTATTPDAATGDSASATPDASSTPDASTDSSAPATDSSTTSSTPDLGSSTMVDPSDDGALIRRDLSPTATSSPSSGTKGRHTKKVHRQRIPTHVLLFPDASSHKAPPPEIEGPKQNATVWLNNPLPDPTPPALRLSTRFAGNLEHSAKNAGVNWALELAILRAKGLTGHAPVGAVTLRRLADRLSSLGARTTGTWGLALKYDGNPNFADKVQALERYNRAVGLNALVHGLESVKKNLEHQLLDDPSISIYSGGRNDIASGKVDVRVLAVISYLHQAFGEVTVTSLISGHRLYARPGVISAHVYGRAVDIGALGGTPILGHQQPGGVTEQAVRDLLLLPSEVMPKQIISLLGLGGPSFPLADHYNHIHIGF